MLAGYSAEAHGCTSPPRSAVSNRRGSWLAPE